MYNFDPYDVLLAIAINIPQRLKTGFVLQGHVCTSCHPFECHAVSDLFLPLGHLSMQTCFAHTVGLLTSVDVRNGSCTLQAKRTFCGTVTVTWPMT